MRARARACVCVRACVRVAVFSVDDVTTKSYVNTETGNQELRSGQENSAMFGSTINESVNTKLVLEDSANTSSSQAVI